MTLFQLAGGAGDRAMAPYSVWSTAVATPLAVDVAGEPVDGAVGSGDQVERLRSARLPVAQASGSLPTPSVSSAKTASARWVGFAAAGRTATGAAVAPCCETAGGAACVAAGPAFSRPSGVWLS